mmetsp:Transcript_18844/g.60481  ORF Transcript_18844/g.60481 Transcript_18844/m.60481 type:complete len:215 (-) Transcript_18844:253-897(-)
MLRQVVQRGAHVGGDARLVLEPREQHALRLGRLPRLQRARHLLPLLRGDREDVVLAHAPDGPRRRVLDLDRRVAHQPDHQVERVRHVRLQRLWRRPLQDGAKSKRRRLAPPPIGRGDVALDEGRHVLHHLVLDHLRHASEAGGRRPPPAGAGSSSRRRTSRAARTRRAHPRRRGARPSRPSRRATSGSESTPSTPPRARSTPATTRPARRPTRP